MDEVVRRVAAKRVTVVFVASGVGKSSLLAAGVLPTLHPRARAVGRAVRALVTTPGNRPLDELRGWLKDSLQCGGLESVAEVAKGEGEFVLTKRLLVGVRDESGNVS